jgi:hypothetical protein
MNYLLLLSSFNRQADITDDDGRYIPRLERILTRGHHDCEHPVKLAAAESRIAGEAGVMALTSS